METLLDKSFTMTAEEGLALVNLLAVVGRVADCEGFTDEAKECALTSLKIVDKIGCEVAAIQYIRNEIENLLEEYN